ncbi:family 16 glycoside hydrolase [Mucilaginibacter calamicampi]|uniref:Family 16 glycoside hydrolase n=1 Tax=Mucilaginibacter calamicampi TaxID=1302352 RepID=A0ABW2YYY5_9SPHI
MKGIKKYLLVTLVMIVNCGLGFPQQRTVSYNLSGLLSSGKLSTTNREATQLAGKEQDGIRISSSAGEGVVWLNEVKFSNGIIELDIKGKNVEQQSFLGVAFHGLEDTKTFDVIYLRPFNFEALDSVKRSHSVQYASHPEYPWQVLREKFNGKYETGLALVPDPNQWFHVRIEVNYPVVKTFVNGAAAPSLVVTKLNDRKSGILGLWVGNNSDGDFANLKITYLDKN